MKIIASDLAKRKNHNVLSPDFQNVNREEQKRVYAKTIMFNAKERAVIEQYCKKYGVTNVSAFIRETVIHRILEQMSQDYPKLF